MQVKRANHQLTHFFSYKLDLIRWLFLGFPPSISFLREKEKQNNVFENSHVTFLKKEKMKKNKNHMSHWPTQPHKETKRNLNQNSSINSTHLTRPTTQPNVQLTKKQDFSCFPFFAKTLVNSPTPLPFFLNPTPPFSLPRAS